MSLGNHPNTLSGGSTTAGGSTPGNFTTVTATSVTAGTITATTGNFTAGGAGTGGVSYGSNVPVTLYVKSVTVLTAGSPADIATITVPSGITRYTLSGTNGSVVGETAAGTLAASVFRCFDAAAGGGNQLTASLTSGPSAAGIKVAMAPNATTTLSTSSTIYVRQTTDSANAGTCSFYLTIYPVP